MSESRESGGTISITAHSDPFRTDPPYASAFYEAIGRIVVMWGRFEQQLDSHLLVALNIAAHHGIELPMQTSLKRKTEVLRDAYKRCNVLSDQSELMKGFTREIENVSSDRNMLIHSNVSYFEDGEPPRLVMRNITHKSGVVTHKTFKAGISDFENHLKSIDGLNTRLLFGFGFKLYSLQPGRFDKAPKQDQSEES